MNDCIDNCTQCHAICLETINYCLEKGGKHAAPEHIALLTSCADICATSASAMLRGSAVHPVICGACAEVCRPCAAECVALDDPEMTRSAETCSTGAQRCAGMER